MVVPESPLDHLPADLTLDILPLSYEHGQSPVSIPQSIEIKTIHRPRQGEGMSLPRPRSVSPMGKSSLRTGSNGARWNSATTSSAAVPSANVSTLSARIERTSFARASSAHANASPTPPPPKTRARFATQLDVDVTPTGRDSSFSGATTAVDEAEAEAELKFQPPRHPPPLSPSQAAAAAAAAAVKVAKAAAKAAAKAEAEAAAAKAAAAAAAEAEAEAIAAAELRLKEEEEMPTSAFFPPTPVSASPGPASPLRASSLPVSACEEVSGASESRMKDNRSSASTNGRVIDMGLVAEGLGDDGGGDTDCRGGEAVRVAPLSPGTASGTASRISRADRNAAAGLVIEGTHFQASSLLKKNRFRNSPRSVGSVRFKV